MLDSLKIKIISFSYFYFLFFSFKYSLTWWYPIRMGRIALLVLWICKLPRGEHVHHWEQAVIFAVCLSLNQKGLTRLWNAASFVCVRYSGPKVLASVEHFDCFDCILRLLGMVLSNLFKFLQNRLNGFMPQLNLITSLSLYSHSLTQYAYVPQKQ